MKLYYADASPFARKVRILAAELGLTDRIEVIAVNPWTDESLRALNPLCKVPTLQADDGAAVFDSRPICVHLDRVAGGSLVTGASTASLVMEALADGVCDAGVRVVRERARQGGDAHQDIVERQTLAIRAGFDLAEKTLARGAFDIGAIALASMLGYVDLRKLNEGWRDRHPKLKAWFDEVSSRPSVVSTAPN